MMIHTLSGLLMPPTIGGRFELEPDPDAFDALNSSCFFESSALRSKKELELTPEAFARLADIRTLLYGEQNLLS